MGCNAQGRVRELSQLCLSIPGKYVVAEMSFRLRREYFCQKEDPCPLHHPVQAHLTGRWSFSLGGHWLSSLYRKVEKNASRLRISENTLISFWQKYSNCIGTTSAASGGRQ